MTIDELQARIGAIESRLRELNQIRDRAYKRLVLECEFRRRDVHFSKTRTHCKRGHDLEVVGVYIQKNGSKSCRECAKIRERERYRRECAEVSRAGESATGWPTYFKIG